MHIRSAARFRAAGALALGLTFTGLASTTARAQHAAPLGAVWPAVDSAPGLALVSTTSWPGEPAASADTVRRRRRAVSYSDWYARRLMVHRIGSYVILPLFAGEYLLGDRLMSTTSEPAGWVKPAHVAVAASIGGVFAVNTVTGLWNAWDSRSDPAGRTRRLVHGALMLAADAGFVYTAAIAEDDDEGGGGDGQRRHRNAALASIGVSTIGTAMMWLWKD